MSLNIRKLLIEKFKHYIQDVLFSFRKPGHYAVSDDAVYLNHSSFHFFIRKLFKRMSQDKRAPFSKAQFLRELEIVLNKELYYIETNNRFWLAYELPQEIINPDLSWLKVSIDEELVATSCYATLSPKDPMIIHNPNITLYPSESLIAEFRFKDKKITINEYVWRRFQKIINRCEDFHIFGFRWPFVQNESLRILYLLLKKSQLIEKEHIKAILLRNDKPITRHFAYKDWLFVVDGNNLRNVYFQRLPRTSWRI
ncbi:MAG: hypothetical protein ABIL44_00900 [candidate division WOR-3 bacterium]